MPARHDADAGPAPPARADRLDAARALLVALVALFGLAAVALVAAAPVRDALVDDPRPALARGLARSAPALEPAGQPSRTPAGHRAIAPDQVPGTSRLAPAPARLLVPEAP